MTDKEIIDIIAKFEGKLSTEKLNSVLSDAIKELRRTDISELPPYTTEMFTKHLYITDRDEVSYKAVEVIKDYRNTHGVGLYQAKLMHDAFVDTHKDEIREALEAALNRL